VSCFAHRYFRTSVDPRKEFSQLSCFSPSVRSFAEADSRMAGAEIHPGIRTAEKRRKEASAKPNCWGGMATEVTNNSSLFLNLGRTKHVALCTFQHNLGCEGRYSGDTN
jgi:hypothetical protein